MRRLELKRVEWTRPVTMINISYKGNNLHPDKKNMFLFFFTSTCHNAMVKFYILTKRIFFCSLVLKIRSVNQQQLWNCHCPNLSRDLNTPINQSFYVMRGSFWSAFYFLRGFLGKRIFLVFSSDLQCKSFGVWLTGVLGAVMKRIHGKHKMSITGMSFNKGAGYNSLS